MRTPFSLGTNTGPKDLHTNAVAVCCIGIYESNRLDFIDARLSVCHFGECRIVANVRQGVHNKTRVVSGSYNVYAWFLRSLGTSAENVSIQKDY